MILDRISPDSHRCLYRTPYHRRTFAAHEALRKALGYEPRNEVIPEQKNASIAPYGTYDHRVTVPAGSWLYAISGGSGEADGFTVQITDFATRSNLFTGACGYANCTGQGSITIADAAGGSATIGTSIHYLETPRPIIEPAVLNVQIKNRSANANRAQLVLWILEPPPPGAARNEYNQELEAIVDLWRRRYPVGAALVKADGTPTFDPLDVPAYNIPFNITGEGDHIIIPGQTGWQISIHQMLCYNAGAVDQDIRLLDGSVDLLGPLTLLGAGVGFILTYQREPHFVLGEGNDFVLNIGGTQVTGFVKYRLLKNWTPGGATL